MFCLHLYSFLTKLFNLLIKQTRWVVVDLGTHCNVGSKRECWPIASCVEWQAANKTLLLRAFGSLYRADASRVTMHYIANGVSPTAPNAKIQFSRGYSVQTVHPHQNSHTKGTSLGCSLAPEMIPVAWNCALYGTLWVDNNDPTPPTEAVFGLANPLCWFMSVCFKNGWNRCRISVRKAALYPWRKNTKHVSVLGRSPRNFFIWVCTVVPLIFQVSSKSIRVLWSYNEKKTLPRLSKVNGI